MKQISFLIHCLRPDLAIPENPIEQRQLLRAAMNVHNHSRGILGSAR